MRKPKTHRPRRGDTLGAVVTNPFQPPTTYSFQSPPSSDSYGQLKRQKQQRRYLLGGALAWIAFVLLTGTFADNVRYLMTVPSLVGYAALVGIGNVACPVCLALSVRGWWRLLVLPIWILCLLELLVLVANLAVGAGIINRPPRQSQMPATETTLPRSCTDPSGLSLSYQLQSVG